MRSCRTNDRPGFTLLELVLVMLIISVAMAMAAPSLRGWSHGMGLTNTADEVLTLARYAQSHSITQANVYRLNFDNGNPAHFWLTVQQGGTPYAAPGATQNFVPVVDSDYGDKHTMPEGVQFTLEKNAVLSAAQNSDAASIDFYPNGRTQTGTITLTDSTQSKVTIFCSAPTELYHLPDKVTNQ